VPLLCVLFATRTANLKVRVTWSVVLVLYLFLSFAGALERGEQQGVQIAFAISGAVLGASIGVAQRRRPRRQDIGAGP
jgi:cyanate permease